MDGYAVQWLESSRYPKISGTALLAGPSEARPKLSDAGIAEVVRCEVVLYWPSPPVMLD